MNREYEHELSKELIDFLEEKLFTPFYERRIMWNIFFVDLMKNFSDIEKIVPASVNNLPFFIHFKNGMVWEIVDKEDGFYFRRIKVMNRKEV